MLLSGGIHPISSPVPPHLLPGMTAHAHATRATSQTSRFSRPP